MSSRSINLKKSSLPVDSINARDVDTQKSHIHSDLRGDDIPNIQPHDSVSNIVSSTSSSSIARQQIAIELEEKKMLMEHEMRKAEHEMHKADMIKEMRKAELEAKRQLLALSNPGSAITGLPTCVATHDVHSPNQPQPTINEMNYHERTQPSCSFATQPQKEPSLHAASRINMPLVEPNAYNCEQFQPCSSHQQNFTPSYHSPTASVYTYHLLLEEAREIRYTGHQLPYIFYYNQITELLQRCSDPSKKMDLLRASCQSDAREAISALVPPVPGWGVETQIARALEGLRLRYGCSSFLSEPLVKRVRLGPKLSRIDVSSLEKLISDINDCELYARAYKQASSLDCSFIIDITERFPFYFKNRYADFLCDQYNNPDQPTFESFKAFLSKELNRINTTFAQRLLGSLREKGENKSLPSTTKVKVNRTNVINETKHIPLSNKSQHHKVEPIGLPNQKFLTKKPLPICFVCSNGNSEHHHLLYNCQTYQNMSLDSRYNAILNAGHCLNCLQQHAVENCTQACKCKYCHNTYLPKHTTSLHDFFSQPRVNLGAAESTLHEPKVSLGAATYKANNSIHDADNPVNTSIKQVELSQLGVFTRVSAVQIKNPRTEQVMLVYAQHDPGSQITLISSSLVQDLGLTLEGKSHLTLHTLSTSQTQHYEKVKFDLTAIHSQESFNSVNAIVIPPWGENTYNLPHNQELSSYAHFDGVTTCVLPNRSSIDIIIGLDNSLLMRVLEERVGQIGEPHAIKTPLGWIASGGKFQENAVDLTTKRVAVLSNHDEKDIKIIELKETIRDLAAENEIIQPSINDLKAQKMVEDNIKVVNDRYEIPVPLKEEVVNLENNYDLAAKRLNMLRKRMSRDALLADLVTTAIRELKQNNYIVAVHKDDEASGQHNYLPYFLTTQVKPRIVYDGSARWKGQCINELIHSGPDQLNMLSHVLSRFRLGRFALMSDLSKCFLQILLPKDQQDLFRILWYAQDDIISGQIEEFKFTRHVWGIICSPYIACTAIRYVTEKNPTGASYITLKAIQDSMYMDDMLLSVNSLEEAKVIASEAIELFKSRGFQLVKWSSNKEAKPVLMSMDENQLASSIRAIDLTTNDPLPDFKAVGCIWEAEHDVLKLRFCLQELTNYTRRSMLSYISRQYDILGFSAPLLLKARLILQELATKGYTWDETVDTKYQKAWLKWQETLCLYKDIAIPRWYFANTQLIQPAPDSVYELHAFSDSSNEAYGCVVYLRIITKGMSSASFVFGKSRVVLQNQKNWAIARKELTAALMSVELIKSACDALQLPNCKNYYWCDSQVVLHWIKNHDLRLPKFVARRIEIILRHSKNENWDYCLTGNNPADVATRPLTQKSSSDQLKFWLEGPNIEDLIANKSNKGFTDRIVHEVRVHSHNSHSDSENILTHLIYTSTNLYTLKKRASYLIAFIDYIKQKSQGKEFIKPCINAHYLEHAMNKIVHYVQQSSFGSVIEKLKQSSPDCFEQILKNSSGDNKTKKNLDTLQCLRPFVDSNDIFRVEGRLMKADLPTDQKHPIILPYRHP